MFEYICGKLTDANPHKVVIDVNGLGYLLFISIATFEKLPAPGGEVKLFTSVVIREDSHKIYGFLTQDERNLFDTLNDISGIGPRISIALLGHMSIQDLHLAVEHANAKILSKVPGIGKKMAERLIIELRDKFANGDKQKISLSSSQTTGIVGDAVSALINLGYNPLDAQKAVKNALPKNKKEPPLSELISLALRNSN